MLFRDILFGEWTGHPNEKKYSDLNLLLLDFDLLILLFLLFLDGVFNILEVDMFSFPFNLFLIFFSLTLLGVFPIGVLIV